MSAPALAICESCGQLADLLIAAAQAGRIPGGFPTAQDLTPGGAW